MFFFLTKNNKIIVVFLFFFFFLKESSISPVQTRSSSRLKQKHNPANEHHLSSLNTHHQTDKRSATIKRHLSTELITTQTSDNSTTTNDHLLTGEYKYLPSLLKQYQTNSCQTTDDIIEIFHQSIQTNHLIKSDKSTYTDFIDQPLCENSTQTIRKEEQETQTTDLNCPNDSQVYFNELKHSQTQCDDLSNHSLSSSTSSPISSPTDLHDHHQQHQKKLSSPYMDFSLTNSK